MEDDIRHVFHDFYLGDISFNDFIHHHSLLREIREFYNYYDLSKNRSKNRFYVNRTNPAKILNQDQYDILENKIMFFDELKHLVNMIQDQLGDPVLDESEKMWVNGQGLLAKDGRGIQNIRLEKILYIHPKNRTYVYDDYEYFALVMVSFIFDKLGYKTTLTEMAIYNPDDKQSIVAGKICLNFGILWHRVLY